MPSRQHSSPNRFQEKNQQLRFLNNDGSLPFTFTEGDPLPLDKHLSLPFVDETPVPFFIKLRRVIPPWSHPIIDLFYTSVTLFARTARSIYFAHRTQNSEKTPRFIWKNDGALAENFAIACDQAAVLHDALQRHGVSFSKDNSLKVFMESVCIYFSSCSKLPEGVLSEKTFRVKLRDWKQGGTRYHQSLLTSKGPRNNVLFATREERKRKLEGLLRSKCLPQGKSGRHGADEPNTVWWKDDEKGFLSTKSKRVALTLDLDDVKPIGKRTGSTEKNRRTRLKPTQSSKKRRPTVPVPSTTSQPELIQPERNSPLIPLLDKMVTLAYGQSSSAHIRSHMPHAIALQSRIRSSKRQLAYCQQLRKSGQNVQRAFIKCNGPTLVFRSWLQDSEDPKLHQLIQKTWKELETIESKKDSTL